MRHLEDCRMSIRPADIGWLGGILDGEGCISIAKAGNVMIRVGSTCDLMVSRIAEIYRYFDIEYKVYNRRMNERNRYQYKELVLYGQDDIYIVLYILVEFKVLYTKMSQAAVVLEYLDTRYKAFDRASYTRDMKGLVSKLKIPVKCNDLSI